MSKKFEITLTGISQAEDGIDKNHTVEATTNKELQAHLSSVVYDLHANSGSVLVKFGEQDLPDFAKSAFADGNVEAELAITSDVVDKRFLVTVDAVKEAKPATKTKGTTKGTKE